MHGTSFRIHTARTPQELSEVSRLFQAYAASLPIDLGYQDFATELATLPGKYAAPEGALLLASESSGTALGCVALRALETPGCCEMKRLYVTPQGRGRGLGRALVEAVIGVAREQGYREMRLDTLPSLTEAITLYHTLGFAPIPAYYDTPIEGTLFFALSLASSSTAMPLAR